MAEISTLQDKAADVSSVLSALANPRRLLILCYLMQHGETAVSGLTEISGLSQSALSQHLAMMRTEGLVGARKDGLNVFYSIADKRVEALIASLEKIYCAV
ncbi:MAG: helix-turn-helix transcriptional regulator [Hyphomicrobiales bacterium]|nr:helix-turn-helix transcriptional regulator [Hyphomicrobiales bacterium]